MAHAFAWPASAFVLGIACGIALCAPPWVAVAALLTALAIAWRAYGAGHAHRVFASVLAGWLAAGCALGSRAERLAQTPPLREAALGDSPSAHARSRRPRTANEPSAREQVVSLIGRLRQDAMILPQGVGLTMDVEALTRPPRIVRVGGGAMLTVLGRLAPGRAAEWRAGRLLRVQAVVREPAAYFDPGVPDFPLSLARRGTALVGSVKSAALVEVLERGSWIEERAAVARQRIRQLIAASVGSWNAETAAIVTAILIGDRAGLDERTERDLQEAGTYHVIAISGGNIAILAACLLLACRALTVPWRTGVVATVLALLAYAELAGGGSSVTRATTMAIVYFGATLIDQRTSPASALGISAALILAVNPLALIDPAFLLTFGATIGIIIGVPLITARFSPLPLLRPALTLLAASAAAEIALLPLGPLFFARVTIAGLLCNFAAVPLMSIVQVSGMAAVAATAVNPSLAHAAGFLPHAAAQALVWSAGLVRLMPWLTWRVPASSPPLIACYYAALVALVTPRVWVRWTIPWHQPARSAVMGIAGISAVLLVCGPIPSRPDGTRLRVVMLDVGQGDATVVQLPSGRTLLVDAGGLGGTARFDVGERVVAPALWRLGVRRLDTLVVTHGDADHVGGAAALLEVFRPHEVWEGVPVPADPALAELAALATARGIAWRTVQAGDLRRDGRVTVRAWHPPLPDWDRQRVRNDDSLVLEVRYGEVSIVLTADIGAAVEDTLVAAISPARHRVLKVPHHGSASSSSALFLAALRPDIAVVSCGRGNRFGHPAPAVLARYAAAGVSVYRTDLQGAITIDTDGKTLRIDPFVPDGSRRTLVTAIERWLSATRDRQR